jgi:hypothetical protein
MTKEHAELIERLTNLTSMTSGQVAELQTMVQTYIDPQCYICNTCPAQIRFAWTRLCEWWKTKKNNYKFVKKLN